MTEHNTEWYFSRSDAENYDKCPRIRYHRTIRDGRGIVKIGSSFELSFGRIVHKATEKFLLGEATLADAAAEAAKATHKVVMSGEIPKKVPIEFQEQFLGEAKALASGLVWTWGIHVYPAIKASYDIVHVETQTAYRKDGLVLPTVADLILRSKDDGTLVYPDWKTAAWVNADWMSSWNRSAQLHTTAKAIEQVIGEPVEYCYVQALVKGRWQSGYMQSPLCYAYIKEDAEPEDKEFFSYKYTSRKGFIRTPQHMTGITMERWVRNMPQEIAMGLVPRTPPIIVDPELADTWWRQRVIKERKIQRAKNDLAFKAPEQVTDIEAIMDEVFPQHFDQCAPVVGFRCDYFDLCHDTHGVGADPLNSGLFRKRPTYQERLAEESAEDDNNHKA